MPSKPFHLTSSSHHLLVQAVAQTQPPGDKTPAPRIKPDHSILDFQTMSASHIFRTHRAITHQRPLLTSYLSSWSPSQTWHDIQLLDISLPEAQTPPADLQPPPGARPGSFVFDKATKTLRVRCADAAVLAVSRVKPANGREMGAEAFWNGVKAKACRAERKGEGVPDLWMVLGLGPK